LALQGDVNEAVYGSRVVSAAQVHEDQGALLDAQVCVQIVGKFPRNLVFSRCNHVVLPSVVPLLLSAETVHRDFGWTLGSKNCRCLGSEFGNQRLPGTGAMAVDGLLCLGDAVRSVATAVATTDNAITTWPR